MVGSIVGRYIGVGDTLFLFGNLGAGKTVFVRGMTEGLKCPSLAKSPTFVLINEYSGRIPLFHCDLYRIDSAQEVIDLDMEALLVTGALAIEWADKFPQVLPPADLKITFSNLDTITENCRKVHLAGKPELLQSMTRELAQFGAMLYDD